MPFLAYLAVTGPLLLAGLILASAYADPSNASGPLEFIGIGPAQANLVAPTNEPKEEIPLFLRLKNRPLNN